LAIKTELIQFEESAPNAAFGALNRYNSFSQRAIRARQRPDAPPTARLAADFGTRRVGGCGGGAWMTEKSAASSIFTL
jgi:hypothetical protein